MDTPTMIWLGIVGIVLVLAIASLRSASFFGKNKEGEHEDVTCFLLFDGTELSAASASAHEFLLKAPVGNGAYSQLLALFNDPTFSSQMEELFAEGKAFSRLAKSIDEQFFEVEAGPVGGMVRVEIRIAGTDAHKQIATQSELSELRAECQMFKEVMSSAPIFVARFDQQGELMWQSDAFKSVFQSDETTYTRLKRTASERICLEDTDQKDHWFTLKKVENADGGKTVYATPVDTLVNAEKSLANFVSTLTETFAHLTTGLAIFDSSGRLSLFNPALTDLTGADPSRLVAQPSIRDFLELLRELRMVPEQRDFSAWRQTITRLELGSREGTYREDWTLPSGRVFKVIGRPHPNGAVALIFEDISSTVTLERRYRDEIELGQAALDRISDAVAIFDTSGSLVFANNAFDDMWHIDSMSSLEAPDIAHMGQRWSETCLPTPIWDRLRGYVTGDQNRTSWQAEVTTKTGRHLQGLFSPLPNGSTLTVFSRSIGIGSDLSLTKEERALLVANSTRDALLAIISSDFQQGQKSPAEETSAAVNLLKSLSALPQSEGALGTDKLPQDLCKFASTRGVLLEIGEWCWSDIDKPATPIPTLIWTFLLAAIETHQSGETQKAMRLTATRSEKAFTLTAYHDGLADDPDGLSIRYLTALANRLATKTAITFEPAKMQINFALVENLSGLAPRQNQAS